MLHALGVPPSGKEVLAHLKKCGWTVVQQRGSHIKMRKGSTMVIVPLHGNKDLGIGLLRALEKQTGEKLR
jgi:predicted RNA binding protein YcfA (HicA-like mRNA interferase family)